MILRVIRALVTCIAILGVLAGIAMCWGMSKAFSEIEYLHKFCDQIMVGDSDDVVVKKAKEQGYKISQIENVILITRKSQYMNAACIIRSDASGRVRKVEVEL